MKKAGDSKGSMKKPGDSKSSKGSSVTSRSPKLVTGAHNVATDFKLKKKAKIANSEGIKHIFLSPICTLLICFPFGVASPYLGWSPTLTFFFNFFAMIPLAKILGDATEELAANLKNDMLSGLLNATFGNAVEMIMTIAFLRQGQYLVVKTTLLGSILSNMLLVLGMSFLCGGLVKSKRNNRIILAPAQAPLLAAEEEATNIAKEQKFNPMGAMVNTTMLLVSCLVFSLVTVFRTMTGVTEGDSHQLSEVKASILPISRECCILMILAYVAYIVFQLFTHSAAMADDDDGEAEEEEEPELTLAVSLGLLCFATVIVSIASEFLTDALEPALASTGMGKSFVGIILLPIVGNACEHAAAIRFAMQDKASLSVGIAVGSSVQIALFVTPFSVLSGWALNATALENMDLDLGPLNVAVMVLSVIIVQSIVADGRSNWLEGYMLCTAYFVIAILYWYLPDVKETITAGANTTAII